VGTSLLEIEQFLKNEELRYTVMEEYIRTSFVTDSYTDQDGDHSLFMVIKPEENGEYFKLIAPNLYNHTKGPYSEALFETLLTICWKTKLLQFEYDALDGEIRGIIEFPLEDSPLTKKQLLRSINGMVQIVDEYHDVILTVMETGIIDFEPNSERTNLAKLASDYYEFLGISKKQDDVKLDLED